jgi:hypothetical protein
MKRFELVGRVLMLLALAGLMLAPHGVAVAGDMDCCPGQQAPLPDCGKDCPSVAPCSFGIGSACTIEAASFEPRVLDGLMMPHGHDFELVSLTGEPPSRPPRV